MENLFNDVSSEFLYRMPFKEIFKNWDYTKSDTDDRLEYLMYAAYCCYFSKKDTLTIKFLKELIKEEFKGDYDKWTWVEGGILLQIHIDHYINDQMRHRLESTFDYFKDDAVRKINRKIFQRRTTGFLLKKRVFPFSVEDKTIDFLKVIPYFSELIFLKTFNESDITNEELSSKISLIEDKVTQVIDSY